MKRLVGALLLVMATACGPGQRDQSQRARHRHPVGPQQPRPAGRPRRRIPEDPCVDLRQPHGTRRAYARRAQAGRAAGPADANHVHRSVEARRALPGRPRADVGGRGVHVSKLSRSRFRVAPKGRLPRAEVCRCHRSVHRGLYAQPAVHVVSHQSRDAHCPGRGRRVSGRASGRHRSVSLRSLSCRRSRRAVPLSTITSTAGRRTTAWSSR